MDPSCVCSSASHAFYHYTIPSSSAKWCKHDNIRKNYLKSCFYVIRRVEGRIRFTCLSMSSSKTSSMSVISVVTSMNSRLAFRSSPVNGSSSLCKVKVFSLIILPVSNSCSCIYQCFFLHCNSQARNTGNLQ